MTAPAPIDHLPFYGPDLDRLAGAFQALGFTVSPHGAYVDPAGDGRWPNRSVFLQAGWFDLLLAPEAPADAACEPKACLFRVDEAALRAAATGALRTDPRYGLERRWRGADAPAEAFEIVNLRERVSPLPLALIARAEPMADVAEAWRVHANAATAIGGVIFGGAEPGPRADAAAGLIDVSVFAYLAAADFAQRFGAGRLAVVVRTASLDAAARALEQGGFAFLPRAGGLDVPAHGPFACGWRFEAGS